MNQERAHLLPLAEEGFELVETSFGLVNSQGCVKVRTNSYSVPLRAGTRVQVKVWPAQVEMWQEGRLWPDMTVATGAIRRFWIWNITWMCWSGSREHWRDRSRWSNGAGRGAGRPATISCGSG